MLYLLIDEGERHQLVFFTVFNSASLLVLVLVCFSSWQAKTLWMLKSMLDPTILDLKLKFEFKIVNFELAPSAKISHPSEVEKLET